MNKQQIVHIHGGEPWNTYDKYLNYLKTVEVEIDFNQKQQKRWYKTEGYNFALGDEKYEIIIPIMPSKYNAKYNEWKIWFERHFEFLHDGIILVGHSLGGNFLAKYLSENILPVSIKQLHLVAPSHSIFEDDFKITEFPKNFFKNNIDEIHIYHSTDDTIVPITESEKYHKALPSSQLHIFNDRFHFLDETFPELFENIKKSQ